MRVDDDIDLFCSIIAGMTTMMGRFKDCEPKDVRVCQCYSRPGLSPAFICWIIFLLPNYMFFHCFSAFSQILALASLAMALLPFGYQKSVAGPREGLTTTIGFQARLSL